MLDQAVILCGGKGKRLLPYTLTIPKPMIKINNINFLQILINQLKANNFKEILLLTGYKHKIIHEYVRQNKIENINCIYTNPKLETGERLKKIQKKLDQNFMLMYGDNYINFDFKKHFNKVEKKSMIHLLLQNKKLANEQGNIFINKKKLKYYKKRNKICDYVEMGYSVVNRNIIFSNSFKSFNDYIILASNLQKITYTKTINKYLSITNPEIYLRSKKWFFENRKIDRYSKIS